MELFQWCSRRGRSKEDEKYPEIDYHALCRFDKIDQEMLEGSKLLEEVKEYNKQTSTGIKSEYLKLRVVYTGDLNVYRKEVKKFLNRYVDEYTKKYE